MVFNSLSFFIFFPVVTALYFIIPHTRRWVFLLLASAVFYMAFIPSYILILLITIGIDYYGGIKIGESAGRTKKIYLVLSVVSTCLVLIIFKYVNFFDANIAVIARFFGWNYPVKLIKIILPIGLSFHTFQSLSYVIEVYRGRQKAERHFGIYSLYVMFFPQLVAGPIERPQNLLHQFYEEHRFQYERVAAGLRKMLWGFFKKMVIADNLALYVNPVYAHPHDYSGLALITATFFFAIQIYCDFSGYSDIAIGAARVMGFELMENFKNPYFSSSLSEFWQRWHISLSAWFRDYVYIPLGGNRVSPVRLYCNIMITFLLSGLWHGASWTYVIWGFIHGVYLIASHALHTIRQKIFPQFHSSASALVLFFKRLGVFSFVLAAWVFFRADTISDAFSIIRNSLSAAGRLGAGLAASTARMNPHPITEVFQQWLKPIAYDRPHFGLFCGLIAVLFAAEIIDYRENLITAIGRQRAWIRFALYFMAVMSIMNLGVTHEAPFIYFQF